VFLSVQIDLIILKTFDQQFTLTTKKSLHIIFKGSHGLYAAAELLVLNRMTAMFADDKDTDRNRTSSKSVSSILNDSNSEDTVPDNVDDRMSAELGAYRSSKTELIQTDPLQFWKNKESTYPNVAMQAQKFLYLPTTSVPRERIFSVAGKIVSRRRSALRPDNVKMLLCLQSWLQ